MFITSRLEEGHTDMGHVFKSHPKDGWGGLGGAGRNLESWFTRRIIITG